MGINFPKLFFNQVKLILGFMQTKEKKRIQVLNRRQKAMNELKINGCAICGYNKCNSALDFHHSNPEDKKFSVNADSFGHILTKNFIIELNKCVLLCKNCHYEITELERGI